MRGDSSSESSMAGTSGRRPRSAGARLEGSLRRSKPLRTSREIAVKSLALLPVFVRRQGPHRQRVDFLAHALAERRIDQLMARNAGLAGERRTDDERLEVTAIAVDFNALARQSLRDIALHVFDRGFH